MDFFEHQDAARRNTTRLVVLFAIAVLAIIVVTYFVVAAAIVGSEGYANAHPVGQFDGYQQGTQDRVDWRRFWDPMLLLYVGAGTVLVVGLSSLYKVSQLSGGGHVVAEALDGRLLHPDTADADERKLLNVVEEMAIASGTPVPPVYLMDEDGINAFAAGYSTDDAVIGVTRGAIRTLSRDELQGVIAHEFSHILNGDMKLNIRLMGIVFGILAIGLVGQMIFRAAIYSGHGRRSRRSGGKDNNPLPLIAIGLALIVVGYVGVLFGNIIKAAVSRQREFLADAAAVQFTRHPDGIAGALKAIGGFASGSKIKAPGAGEVSHMFFSQALTSWLGGAMATHPPLAERIRRIDPSFDGSFASVSAKPAGSRPGEPAEVSRGFAGAGMGPGTSRRSSSTAPNEPAGGAALSRAIRYIGAPSAAHVDHARQIIASLPEALREAAKDAFSARALVFALLMDDGEAVRTNQLEIITRLTDSPTASETRRLFQARQGLSAGSRLPLIELALPALGAMSVSQHRVFDQCISELVRTDERVTLFEWMLERLLARHVTTRFENVSRTPAHYYTLKPVLDDAGLLLSTLAWAGHDDPSVARSAYNDGIAQLTDKASSLDPPRMLPRDQVGLKQLDGALEALNRCAPRVKKSLLVACAACISADRTVTVAEAELFRAVADVLDCPMPPIETDAA